MQSVTDEVEMKSYNSKRTTVDVKALVEEVNYRNRESTCSAEVRDGWNSLLEEVLMSTKNYAGFGWLSAKEVPAGERPGIVWSGEGTDNIGTPSFPDDSRRVYYVK
jgi:hypothetical protein